ncbi:MAG: ArsR/SmtB family transcription factor [Thermoplasmata archaeon]
MAADVFAILADPTRRRIVEGLHEGERSVGDLVAEVDIRQPGVSRHLRILKEAGFVSVRAEGRRRLYSLRPEPLAQLDDWMRTYAREQLLRLNRLSRLVDRQSKEGK